MCVFSPVICTPCYYFGKLKQIENVLFSTVMASELF